MIRIRPHRLLSFVLLGSIFVLSGCMQGATVERKYYLLDVTRAGPPDKIHTSTTLRVRRFNVDEAFASQQLMYRVSEFQYEPDYYHQFLVLPGVMLTEETRNWLADSGLFDRVTAAGSRMEPMYVLEGSVIDLYGDFRDKSAPVAVVAIRFFLLTDSEGSEMVALSRTYRADSPIVARTAEGIVGALSKSLSDILTRLEADIEKTLA
ncbi:MAG: ABC-type transport auxiliary lipoprotein family protein [Planctomycetes bacterium]|nr:ABC-type transport auxiliary lipoprotein family protein [Planctomycetota bacterium]